MNPYLTVGLSAFAAAALFEAALIPGIVIGGAAVLAPKYLPELRRRLQPAFDAIIGARIEPPIPLPDRQDVEPTLSVPAELAIQTGPRQDGHLSDYRYESGFHHELRSARRACHRSGSIDRRPGGRPVALFCARNGLELLSWVRRNLGRPAGSPAGRRARSARVYDQSGVGQDHNLWDHRHSGRLHHKLRGGRRHRHGGRSVGFCLCGRTLCLFWPRKGLALFQRARRAHARRDASNKPRVGNWPPAGARGREPSATRRGYRTDGRLPCPPALRPPSGCSAPPPAHRIDIGSRLEERIGRGFDAVHSRDRIKDDALLLAGVVRDDLPQTDFAKRALRTLFGPADCGIINRVAPRRPTARLHET